MGFGGKPPSTATKPDPQLEREKSEVAARQKAARGFKGTVYSNLLEQYGGGQKQTFGA